MVRFLSWLDCFSHSRPVPRRELRIITSGTARIIIDTMPTTVISILLVNTIDTMRATMFTVTTPFRIVGKVLARTRIGFRRVCNSRPLNDRPLRGTCI